MVGIENHCGDMIQVHLPMHVNDTRQLHYGWHDILATHTHTSAKYDVIPAAVGTLVVWPPFLL